MNPLDFIASLDGEAKAAALTVYNLMTPKWIEITDDPATLPPSDEWVVLKYTTQVLVGARQVFNNYLVCMPSSCVTVSSAVPTHWRAI